MGLLQERADARERGRACFSADATFKQAVHPACGTGLFPPPVSNKEKKDVVLPICFRPFVPPRMRSLTLSDSAGLGWMDGRRICASESGIPDGGEVNELLRGSIPHPSPRMFVRPQRVRPIGLGCVMIGGGAVTHARSGRLQRHACVAPGSSLRERTRMQEQTHPCT